MVESSVAEVAPATDRSVPASSSLASRAPDAVASRLELLKAVADPIRLAVLDNLAAGGARCHCDLEVELGLAANRLSFHLKVLKRAGLVRSERRGRRVHYQLVPGALASVRAAIPTLHDPDHLTATCSACEAAGRQAHR